MKSLLLLGLLAGATPAADTPPPAEVVVVAVGDIRVGGPIGRLVKKFGVSDPVRLVKQWLKGDFLLGNLECAITKRGDAADKTWTFRAPEKELAILKETGFDWLGLANNHVMDYGKVGLDDTIAALKKRGFAHTGAGVDAASARKPLFFQKNGLTVGLLAFTTTIPKTMWAKKNRAGVSYANFKKIPSWVASAKKKCDILLVFFHGGTELSTEPNQVQRDFAHLAADAGADAVIGHHPHVIQPVELRGNSIILYSIGNFLFVSPTPGTERSVIARLHLRKSGVRAEFVPINVNWGRLRPASTEDREIIHKALNGEGALVAHPDRFTIASGRPG